MNTRNNEKLLSKITALLDLPDSAYEKATARYQDIGEWLGRGESSCMSNDPHIFPQGSFRLGTAIRPLSGIEEYDLDLACNLRTGVSASTHSQEQLKLKIGKELEQYRIYRNIKAPLNEKHRCWRLEYADTLNFHMDIVPCIPENETRRKSLALAMENYGMDRSLATSVSEFALGITDDRLPEYKKLNSEWMISNPEGYAKWFESKMVTTSSNRYAIEAAQIDDIPTYKKKLPLQKVIQLLKRHRDKMFASASDSKPISVIITTLAAQSYSGSPLIEGCLRDVLNGLNRFVVSNSWEVPNPVNPEENFADRWSMPQYKELQLKRNFDIWVENVVRDFEFILASDDLDVLTESVENNFSVTIPYAELVVALGIDSLATTSYAADAKIIESPASKPWYVEG